MKRNILITGSSRGLGKSLLNTFEKNTNYNVFSLSRSNFKSIENKNHFVADLSNPENVKTIFGKKIFFDILINNAGVYYDDPRKNDTANISDLDLDIILKTYNTNFFSPLELTRVFYEQFCLNSMSFGRIINISSGMGRLDKINDNSFAYSSSKLLLNSITIAYSKIFETISDDIGIASICPGWIKTDMGTEYGLIDPDIAAEYILSTINLPKNVFNGKFLRYGENLEW